MMTIKTKILCLVAASAVLATAITALSLKTMNDYNHIIENYRHNSENAFRGERLNRYLNAGAVEMRGVYLAETRDEALFQADRVDQRVNTLQAFLDDWQTHLKPGELPELAKVRADCMSFVRGGHNLARITREQGVTAADAYGNKDKYRLFREAMQARIDTMVTGLEAKLAGSQAEVTRFESQRQGQFLIMATSGILLLLGGSLWLAIGSITNPLARVRESMVRISEGAYDTPLPQNQVRGEIGELWGALGILKDRAAEADRMSREKLENEHKLRELVLD